MFERCEPRAQYSGFVQDLQSVLVTGDVQLVARPSLERAAAVRSELRGNAKPAQKAERAASDGRVGDVEVDRDLAAAFQVNAAGRVKEPGELSEPIALVPGRDRRELVAEILRE